MRATFVAAVGAHYSYWETSPGSASALLLVLAGALGLIAGLVLAKRISGKFLWLAALGNWILSLGWGFSIGAFTQLFTWVFLALAVGFSLGWLRTARQEAVAAALGVAAWAALLAVGDRWVFFPLGGLLGLALP